MRWFDGIGTGTRYNTVRYDIDLIWYDIIWYGIDKLWGKFEFEITIMKYERIENNRKEKYELGNTRYEIWEKKWKIQIRK